MLARSGAILIASLCLAAAQNPIPRIEKRDGQTRFIVDGSPYLILGGQLHNSTTSNADDLAKALDILASWHANSAEVPIY